MDCFACRRLGPTDASAFRHVRLDGLKRHPEAFAASWEEASERSLAWFAETLETQIVFGAWLGNEPLAGVAGLHVPEAHKLRHKGTLWGLYVRPETRRAGIGTALIRMVVAHAATCVKDLGLSVGAANDAAIRRYESMGFTRYGLEPRALKVDGKYYDEVLMNLRLACELTEEIGGGSGRGGA